MVGGELGSGQPPLGSLSHLEFVSGWFSFGYISPKSKGFCDPYRLGSDITKKEKRMAALYWAHLLGPAAGCPQSVSGCCDASHLVAGEACGA